MRRLQRQYVPGTYACKVNSHISLNPLLLAYKGETTEAVSTNNHMFIPSTQTSVTYCVVCVLSWFSIENNYKYVSYEFNRLTEWVDNSFKNSFCYILFWEYSCHYCLDDISVCRHSRGREKSDRMSRPSYNKQCTFSTASRNREMPLPCMRVPGY